MAGTLIQFQARGFICMLLEKGGCNPVPKGRVIKNPGQLVGTWAFFSIAKAILRTSQVQEQDDSVLRVRPCCATLALKVYSLQPRLEWKLRPRRMLQNNSTLRKGSAKLPQNIADLHRNSFASSSLILGMAEINKHPFQMFKPTSSTNQPTKMHWVIIVFTQHRQTRHCHQVSHRNLWWGTILEYCKETNGLW